MYVIFVCIYCFIMTLFDFIFACKLQQKCDEVEVKYNNLRVENARLKAMRGDKHYD